MDEGCPRRVWSRLTFSLRERESLTRHKVGSCWPRHRKNGCSGLDRTRPRTGDGRDYEFCLPDLLDDMENVPLPPPWPAEQPGWVTRPTWPAEGTFTPGKASREPTSGIGGGGCHRRLLGPRPRIPAHVVHRHIGSRHGASVLADQCAGYAVPKAPFPPRVEDLLCQANPLQREFDLVRLLPPPSLQGNSL